MEKKEIKTYKPKASNVKKLDLLLNKIRSNKETLKQGKIKWDGF